MVYMVENSAWDWVDKLIVPNSWGYQRQNPIAQSSLVLKKASRSGLLLGMDQGPRDRVSLHKSSISYGMTGPKCLKTTVQSHLKRKLRHTDKGDEGFFVFRRKGYVVHEATTR